MIAPLSITSFILGGSRSARYADIVVSRRDGGGCLLKIINKECNLTGVLYIYIYKGINCINLVASNTQIDKTSVNGYSIIIKLPKT